MAVVDPGQRDAHAQETQLGRGSGRGLQIVGAIEPCMGLEPIAGHVKAVWRRNAGPLKSRRSLRALSQTRSRGTC